MKRRWVGTVILCSSSALAKRLLGKPTQRRRTSGDLHFAGLDRESWKGGRRRSKQQEASKQALGWFVVVVVGGRDQTGEVVR